MPIVILRYCIATVLCSHYRDAIEFLSGEGHIYSTVDDDHFKATDS